MKTMATPNPEPMTPSPRRPEQKRKSASILIILLVVLALIAAIFLFVDTSGEDTIERDTKAVPMQKEGVIEDRNEALDAEPGAPPQQAPHDENNPSPTAPPTQP